MAFNNRVPVPLDPAADPNLPQADASQAHDIPTGVSPTTAKLQDWIAWVRQYAVVYLTPGTPGTISNNIIISGNLDVTGSVDIAGAADFGSNVIVGGDLDIGGDLDVTGDVTSPMEFQEMVGVRGGFSAYRTDHGTLAANDSASDANYLHSFAGASASVDVALLFDATTPGLIHCYCTSASLANVIEFRYTGILIATWPACANRPYTTFVMGALLPEPVAHGGGATF